MDREQRISHRVVASTAWMLIAALFLASPLVSRAQQRDNRGDRTGPELYRDACATCHGGDGTGAPKSRVVFDKKLPDFTDCNFATREPNSDWLAIIHQGGPARGFSHRMPSFRDALTDAEIERLAQYLRTFCGNKKWPRGELNLPRPLVTSKAYPEDEAVITSTYNQGGLDTFTNELVYEHRIGALNEVEVGVPFGWLQQRRDDGSIDWSASLGDVALGAKRVLYHNLERGSIVSVGGEVKLPTGDEAAGFGNGTTVFEPFVSYGQILPGKGFLHAQGGFGLPADTDHVEREAFLNVALGKSFTPGRYGRRWSPMVEVLGTQELSGAKDSKVDVMPQLQVTLSRRQHIAFDIGVRVPVTQTDTREPALMMYLLWDWFDGGLLEGW